ncbi:MAG: hypothetical protein LC790_15580 [Actinobacteria bacterium]|nr:hypothetical protein [Actinomycetota bacterium]
MHRHLALALVFGDTDEQHAVAEVDVVAVERERLAVYGATRCWLARSRSCEGTWLSGSIVTRYLANPRTIPSR